MAPKKFESIAEARKARGLTQQQLASKVGAHWITISKLERGIMRMTYEWASKLSEALQYNIEDIFNLDANYKTDVLNLSGVISDKGNILQYPQGSGNVVATDISKTLKNQSLFMVVDTEYFAPIIRPNDVIRLTNIPEGIRNRFVGRLCFGKYDDNGFFGLAYYSPEADRYELRSLNGNLINSSPVILIACMTMIVSAWHLFADASWREFDSKGQPA